MFGNDTKIKIVFSYKIPLCYKHKNPQSHNFAFCTAVSIAPSLQGNYVGWHTRENGAEENPKGDEENCILVCNAF